MNENTDLEWSWAKLINTKSSFKIYAPKEMKIVNSTEPTVHQIIMGTVDDEIYMSTEVLSWAIVGRLKERGWVIVKEEELEYLRYPSYFKEDNK